MNRHDETPAGRSESTAGIEPSDAHPAGHQATSCDCPPESVLYAAAHGAADSLCLDTLADHLSRCDKCVQLIETLIGETWSGRAWNAADPFGSFDRARDELVTKILESEPGEGTRSGQRELLGRYRLGRNIGQGGMGNVYLAYDAMLGRNVAVKMLRVDSFSPKALDRFELEARAQATLNHPNIVSLFEFGHHQGLPFLVMEFVSGGPLSKILRDRPLPSKTAARLMVPITRAVAHAHHKGLLHRDLKPSNILIAADADSVSDHVPTARELLAIADSAVPKIADFGLARILTEEMEMSRGDSLVGTVAYLAPERISETASSAGPESDIYALGVILYECLTGRPPFQSEDAPKTLAMIRELEPVPPSDLKPDVPKDLETICLKCLEKEPRHRYGSADELADDLQRYLDDLPIRARPLGFAASSWRWCLRNRAAAAAITTALTSLACLSLAGWWIAGTRAELLESTRASAFEARRLAAVAENARQAEARRRELALQQFMSGTTALNRFGITLEAASGEASGPETLDKLRKVYRSELAKLADQFLEKSEGFGDSPEVECQVLSMASAAHARNGELQRSLELYRRLESKARAAEKQSESMEKPRFFVFYAASSICNEYVERHQQAEMIRFATECLDRWSIDFEDPKASNLLMGMIRNMTFGLRAAQESHGSPAETGRLDKILAEMDQVLDRRNKRNP